MFKYFISMLVLLTLLSNKLSVQMSLTHLCLQVWHSQFSLLSDITNSIFNYRMTQTPNNPITFEELIEGLLEFFSNDKNDVVIEDVESFMTR